jgi:lysophospholipid acyltransferase (LPLAT)-like uncharacterized protein
MTLEDQVSAPKTRRSGLVIPQRLTWTGETAACAIWLLGSALSSTWRVRIRDETGAAESAPGQYIAAIWHNRLALAMPIWHWWQKHHAGGGLAALISASRDGALLARTFSYFGVKPIRGSSSRRGAQALLELTSALEENLNVAITPDGPRGPKYKVQPGIISLAQVTGVRIVPIGVHIFRKKELRSWDGFQIPLPFTRCEAVLGRAIQVARDASPEEQEQARQTLESALLSLNQD